MLNLGMTDDSTRKGGYAQDYFTLRSTYFQGRPPKSVNMYWRRFAISDIPVDDHDAFDAWLMQRWREKDELLDGYLKTGVFPTDEAQTAEGSGAENGFINTEVKIRSYSGNRDDFCGSCKPYDDSQVGQASSGVCGMCLFQEALSNEKSSLGTSPWDHSRKIERYVPAGTLR